MSFENSWNLLAGVSALHLGLTGAMTGYRMFKRMTSRNSLDELCMDNTCESFKAAREDISQHLPLLTALALSAHMKGQSFTLSSTSARAIMLMYVIRAASRLCCSTDATKIRKLGCLATMGEYGILGIWMLRMMGYMKMEN